MRKHLISCAICSLVIILCVLQFACAGDGLRYPGGRLQSRIAASQAAENTSETAATPASSESGNVAVDQGPVTPNAIAGVYPKPTRYDYQDYIDINGETREYLVHIPQSYDGSKAVPLVLVFHGYLGNPESIAGTTGFNAVSDSNGFIVVYPAGIQSTWHFLLSTYDRQMGDTVFTSTLIDKLAKELNIDTKMVYSAGFSDGAGFTHSLACRLSDKIAAGAMVAAPFSQAMEDGYQPPRPVPVMIIHGTKDPVIKFEGGTIGLPYVTIVTLPVRDLVNYWVGYDGCSATPATSELPDAHDGTKVDIEQYSNSEGAQVIFYIVEGGGHTWPGGNPTLGGMGTVSKTFNASQVIWQFFKMHPMK